MKLKLYQVVVLLHPEDKDSEIIVPITAILAKDPNHAAIKANRLIPLKYENRLDYVETIVNPFV